MTLPTVVERVADALLLRSGLRRAMSRHKGSGLRVLAYHAVHDEEVFERQVEHLREGYCPVSLGAILAACETGTPVPERSVLVTFDDGDPTLLTRALPVLRAYDVPAVAFVIAGLIGTRGLPWWKEAEALLHEGVTLPGLDCERPADAVRQMKRLPDGARRRLLRRLREAAAERVRGENLTEDDLRTLERSGVEVGNHTLTHPCLDRCPDSVVREEIVRAHDRLVGMLGHAPRAFAFPNGNFDSRAVPHLRERGYEAAFLFDHRIGPWPAPDPFRISRLRVGTDVSFDRFRLILEGVHSTLHHAVGRA